MALPRRGVVLLSRAGVRGGTGRGGMSVRKRWCDEVR